MVATTTLQSVTSLLSDTLSDAFGPWREPCDVGKTYELQERIGTSQVGSVRRAIHRHTGKEVAVKIIKKCANNLDHPTNDHDINRELDAMQRVSDAHCVKLIEVFETPEEVQMVLELMQ